VGAKRWVERVGGRPERARIGREEAEREPKKREGARGAEGEHRRNVAPSMRKGGKEVARGSPCEG